MMGATARPKSPTWPSLSLPHAQARPRESRAKAWAVPAQTEVRRTEGGRAENGTAVQAPYGGGPPLPPFSPVTRPSPSQPVA